MMEVCAAPALSAQSLGASLMHLGQACSHVPPQAYWRMAMILQTLEMQPLLQVLILC